MTIRRLFSPRSTACLIVWTATLAWPSAVLVAQGFITTVAGTEWSFPARQLPAAEAPLGFVRGVAAGLDGEFYVADPDSHMVMKVDRDGVLTVVAGNGIGGYSGDGGDARNASLRAPFGVAVGSGGELYIADQVDHRIRRVGPDGVISTVAGNGRAAPFNAPQVPAGAIATQTPLNAPADVAVDSDGVVFIAEQGGGRILRVAPDGGITSVVDSLRAPTGIDVDGAGELLVAEAFAGRVIRVTPEGRTTAVEINYVPPFDRGTLSPIDVAVDGTGRLYVALQRAHVVIRIDPDGVATAVAGNGFVSRAGAGGFAGDGGQATEASLAFPFSVDVSPEGELFIADSDNRRVRAVSPNGIIDTRAGNGTFRFSGDGGPATSANFNFPQAVAVDENFNLFVADTFNHRVRLVSPDGRVQTIAGTGERGFAGDGGAALLAQLNRPEDLDIDASGNIYVFSDLNDTFRRITPNGMIGPSGYRPPSPIVGDLAVDRQGNVYDFGDLSNGDCRIRRFSPDGTEAVIAGTGVCGSTGDGGQATEAQISSAVGTIGADGAIYLVDVRDQVRLRRIDSSGQIMTVAGNGARGSTGDGGPALAAMLNSPTALAVDAVGTLFLLEGQSPRIRRIGIDGFISTVAGNGRRGFSGDGGLATQASILSSFQGDVAVDPAGNLYIADPSAHRIRKVLAEAPALAELGVDILQFSAASRGAPPEPQSVTLATSVVGMAYSASSTTDEGGDWLRIDPQSGSTPRLLQVTADPLNLAPGAYTGEIMIAVPGANPSSRSLAVELMVRPEIPPRIRADVDSVSFTYPRNSPARSSSLLISNEGSGTVDFSIRTATEIDQEWLSVDPSSGSATPVSPVTVEATASPVGLPAGTYNGRILIDGADRTRVVIAVKMTISELDQALLLTQSGLSFEAVENGGIVAPQTFGVINLGSGELGWSVSTCTLIEGSCDWLRTSPGAGSSSSTGDAPFVTVSVDPVGLTAGSYFGLVEITSPTAANSPQLVTVYLDVLPAGSDPGASLSDSELVYTSISGLGSPSSQDVLLYNVTAEPKTFRAAGSIGTGRLEVLPYDGTLDPSRPFRVTVQPFTDDVAAGEYDGNVTLQFSDGRVRQVELRLVVAGENAGLSLESQRDQPGRCSPSKLLPRLRTLGDGFSVSAGWPIGLQVEVTDDCGRKLDEGSVLIEFSNGDPQVALTPLRNGLWEGTWNTGSASLSEVSLRLQASVASRGLTGAREIHGRFRAIQLAPALSARGVVGAADFTPNQALAPGELITLFGAGLSEGEGAAERLPLPERIQSTSVFFAGTPMPLLFASDGQVNAMIPYSINANTRHHLVLQRGPTLSLPVSVTVAEAHPSVFLNPVEGALRQGHVYLPSEEGLRLAGPTNPARAGDALVIYASGLGSVAPAVSAGEAAPGTEPLARTTLSVRATVSGVEASVVFSGLAPGFSGLYQINAVLPAGLTADDGAALVLTAGGQSSQPVTLAVR